MNPIFVLLTIVILLSGILVSGVYSFDAFAAPSDKGQEQGQAKGCENASDSGKSNGNNKHCGNGSGSGLPLNTCDGSDNSTPDGAIAPSELNPDEIPGTSTPTEFIQSIEDFLLDKGDNIGTVGVIDTADEWDLLQLLAPGICLPEL